MDLTRPQSLMLRYLSVSTWLFETGLNKASTALYLSEEL